MVPCFPLQNKKNIICMCPIYYGMFYGTSKQNKYCNKREKGKDLLQPF